MEDLCKISHSAYLYLYSNFKDEKNYDKSTDIKTAEVYTSLSPDLNLMCLNVNVKVF